MPQSTMLRYIVTSFLALLLTGCSSTPSDPGTSSQETTTGQASASGKQLDSVTQSLLGYAASDFGAHPPAVAQVRNVRVGYVVTAQGKKQYLLCGEFVPAHSERKGEWTTFATIKTDPYEQWLGGLAESWCRNPKVNWEKSEGDLSSALQSRLDSLK